MTAYQIKCNNCNKQLTTITLNLGFAEYAAESHMMDTGHTTDVIEVN